MNKVMLSEQEKNIIPALAVRQKGQENIILLPLRSASVSATAYVKDKGVVFCSAKSPPPRRWARP